MEKNNKAILEKANAAISAGDYEGFLTHCTEDTKWTFLGEQVLTGKAAVRKYMAETYVEPPHFNVEYLIGEGDLVTAVGKISLKNTEGVSITYDYCDVWRFREGKMAELKAFVVETKASL